MQVTAIYAGVSQYAQKLDYVFNIFSNTASELGIKIEKIDITKLNIDNFSAKKLTIIENIFNNIKNSSAVIFVCTAKFFAPCGAMQSFIEHFDQEIYPNTLAEKPCYNIITSFDGSEFTAGNYLSTVVNSLGASSIGNMLIGSQYLNGIETSLETTQMIERYAEDFYRIVKQNRKLFQSKPFAHQISKETKAEPANINSYQMQGEISRKELDLEIMKSQLKRDKGPTSLNGQQVANLYQRELDNQYKNNFATNSQTFKNPAEAAKPQHSPQKNTLNSYERQEQSGYQAKNSYNNSDYTTQLQKFNSYQDDDISEITSLLSSQYKENAAPKISEAQKILNGGNSKQRTQSLHHYFQPQIAKDMDIVMQLNISGEENFNGFFEIKNGDCKYIEGISPIPSLTIISDSNVWSDVLSSKYTLQKAFMLGKVKVKGNFVIISKFEQIFKLD